MLVRNQHLIYLLGLLSATLRYYNDKTKENHKIYVDVKKGYSNFLEDINVGFTEEEVIFAVNEQAKSFAKMYGHDA